MCVKYVHVYTERIWQENSRFREDAATMGQTRGAQSAPNTHQQALLHSSRSRSDPATSNKSRTKNRCLLSCFQRGPKAGPGKPATLALLLLHGARFGCG